MKRLFYLSYRYRKIWQWFIFTPFMVTGLRGISRTAATSLIDLLVTLVSDIKYCRKELYFSILDVDS